MKAYERLLRYAAYPTASDPSAESCPSTPSQLEFGKALVREMRDLGIADAHIDANGYVFGTVPANCGTIAPVIGFIAHMDVTGDAPGADIKAKIVKNYDGGDILLNEELNIVMSPDRFESLRDYAGHDLIVTDGTTLLGADDKAGIAEILTMAEYFLAHPEIEHGTIKIGFTPDEEIGRGADLFDVERFGADFAYTVDGASCGEIVFETFNAATANVTVTGKSMHPGAAKNKLVNASLVAMEFNSMLPPAQRPEHTEGYEGFYHITEMRGRVEEAFISYIVRDHDYGALTARKEHLLRVADFLNKKYGEGAVAVDIRETYLNMESRIREHWHLVTTAREAVGQIGETPRNAPIRGGTDGSRLSFMGLPCPNLGTGSHNHHSRMEYASVQAMDKCVEILVAIAKLYAKGGRQ